MNAQITAREREVLALVAAGHTNPGIAAMLRISVGTVKKHIEHARYRLGATNRSHAVVLAEQAGAL